MHETYMRMAITKAIEGRDSTSGGAFGAVIVHEGKVVVSVHNQVKKEGDLTQHAELYAVQEASQRLGRAQLKEAILYTSCEPCMMCLGACHWADFKAIYFGASAEDAREHGYLYSEVYYAMDTAQRHREFRMTQLLRDEAVAVWK